ncbi:MAG: hypothetical protein AAB916_01830 [Patescibacteria group bacterium]
MNTETRQCQNCKNPFTIEPEDFAFYEKMQVPPPTFCFDCRLQRRLAFRNERILYKKKCEAPGHAEESISVFSPDNPQRTYDHQAWWSDTWNPLDYGKEIDWSKPFFAQLQEVWRAVPDIAVLNINPVNSEYCSTTEGNKNCYLVFGGDFNENTLYSTYVFNSKECVDTYWVSKSEFNYETVDCISCARLSYSRYCDGCYDSAFLLNCKNCHDCFGCVNLKNKSYCLWNEQLTKEEYQKRMKDMHLGDAKQIAELKRKFADFSINFPRRFARLIQTVHSTGDNLEQAKNCRQCFDVFGGAEDCAYDVLAYSRIKDCFDVDRAGLNTELVYESSSVYPGSRVFFSRFVFNCHDIHYSYNCHHVSNLFGCVGVRNKQYCILNKQYSEAEYNELVPKLIRHMKDLPYTGKQGRSYAYGEFFPVEISPFAYNETLAQEVYPLTKEKALARGFSWRDPDEKTYIPTLACEDIPDDIANANDSILKKVIECGHKGRCEEQCTKAFKIIAPELEFYRRIGIPLPKLCPSCRHYGRVRQRNPVRLWSRSCQCGGLRSANGTYVNETKHFHDDQSCPNEFQTSYSPDRPEIVYCEECYQDEVA